MPPGYPRNVVPAVWFRSPSGARDAHQRAHQQREDVMGSGLSWSHFGMGGRYVPSAPMNKPLGGAA
jgi:hypothetical protein